MADCKGSSDESETNQTPKMKIDSPEESNDNSNNDESEKVLSDKDSDNSSSSNSLFRESRKIKPQVTLWAPDHFSVSSSDSPSKSSSIKLRGSLLRPSALSAVANSSTSPPKSSAETTKISNPFAKVDKKSDDESEDKAQKVSNEDNKTGESEKPSAEEKNTEQPKFLPLNNTSNKDAEPSTVSSTLASGTSAPSFVFGQNLKDRVAKTAEEDSSEKKEESVEAASENGSSELMFSNAATVCKSTSNNDKPDKTLSEAAQEMEEATRANKRKYDEVALLTGEEDEINVLQINCKLFAFDKATSSYQERGRGSLRLNDRDDESRLIGRAAGTQRLVLNTKVWPGMTAERAGSKSLRITAMDIQGDVRIFVVQAAQKEIEQLHALLLSRLRRAKERQTKKPATEN
ncbi:ran-binding protein 3 [Trichogramma pretiosum]|uniref:ran-binding protein 3 n=1 Tax=Trichogramma pretiosum TaxID=7493 RepID=UPI0006C9DF35|nr:ran-binding protein 3 [Trichogramma pretiosum]